MLQRERLVDGVSIAVAVHVYDLSTNIDKILGLQKIFKLSLSVAKNIVNYLLSVKNSITKKTTWYWLITEAMDNGKGVDVIY